MGTNYHLHQPPDAGSVPIHIGKSSAGWVFLWRGYRGTDPAGRPIASAQEWLAFLAEETAAGAEIRNDSDRRLDLDEFVGLIRRAGSLDSMGRSPGRTADVDPEHCVKAGDTDLSFDEFS